MSISIGSGHPLGKVGETIHLFARIALLAQVVEVFFHEHGPQAAVDEIGRRRGTWFDPQVVDASESGGKHPLLAGSRLAELEEIVLGSEPGHQAIMADEDYLTISRSALPGHRRKSPYTSGHSNRVRPLPISLPNRWG